MPSFVFDVLFIPSFHALSYYFYISLSLIAVSTLLSFVKFRDTASLTSGGFGEGPGSPLFLDQTRPEGPKKKFSETGPPLISGSG